VSNVYYYFVLVSIYICIGNAIQPHKSKYQKSTVWMTQPNVSFWMNDDGLFNDSIMRLCVGTYMYFNIVTVNLDLYDMCWAAG